MSKLITTAIVALALMLTPMALAENAPVVITYGGQGTPTQEVLAGSDSSSSGGSLPFTGLDLAIVLVGGLALLGAGIGLRRVSRQRDEG